VVSEESGRKGGRRDALTLARKGRAAMRITLKYSLFPILGDGTMMVFMTCAFLTWSYMMAQLFYAYCALQRSMKTSTHTMVHSR
ncbi:hypothetical protein, partial [Serratia marcescens]|uniref:hypothetical protein n=1 Tax=Serratia marcescens TaxID=615 RepID=UPI0034E1D667